MWTDLVLPKMLTWTKPDATIHKPNYTRHLNGPDQTYIRPEVGVTRNDLNRIDLTRDWFQTGRLPDLVIYLYHTKLILHVAISGWQWAYDLIHFKRMGPKYKTHWFSVHKHVHILLHLFLPIIIILLPALFTTLPKSQCKEQKLNFNLFFNFIQES